MGQPLRKATLPDHEWRGRTTIMWPVEEGMWEFLASPAAGRPDAEGYLVDAIGDDIGRAGARGFTNSDILSIRLGSAGGVDSPDPQTFEAIAELSGRRVRTFREAWRVVADAYNRFGHRDWRDVRLNMLQDCCPEFQKFRLPEWVEEMKIEEEIANYYTQQTDDEIEDAA